MNKPITLNLDCTKIDKALMKNGRYLNLVVWPNKKGTDEHGNTHYVAQSVTKEQRESGVKGPIIGNAKIPDGAPHRPSSPRRDPDLDNPDIGF